MAAFADSLVVMAALWALSRAKGFGVGAVLWRVGLGLVVIASAVGTLRFLGFTDLSALHDTLSSVATFVGMPLMTVGLVMRLYGTFNVFVVPGVALAVAAVVLNGAGEWHGISREDLFHVLFGSALLCFGLAYQRR